MTSSTSQYKNAAGSGLSHVPRRRSHSNRRDTIPEAANGGQSKSSSPRMRGRERPHFAFGDDDTGTESSAEEDRLHNGADAIESESDCATPTQADVSRFREATVRPLTIFDLRSNTSSLAQVPNDSPLNSPHRVKREDDTELSISFFFFPSLDEPRSSDMTTSSSETVTQTSSRPNEEYRRTKSEDLDPDSLVLGNLSQSSRSLSESTSLNLSRPTIRNRAGQIIKPALKSQRSSSATPSRPRMNAHPNLSVSMSCLDDFPSMTHDSSASAPTTPDPKMVHFDAQLEHVRLFRSGQKPIAISRDSSPMRDDTTSGGEWDSSAELPERPIVAPPRPSRRKRSGAATCPASDEEEEVRRSLSMHLTNMRWGTSAMGDLPGHVRLEGLHLSDDNTVVQGFVRVRNVAFEKQVMIRFTFDGWQTTSEIMATWKESYLPFTPQTPMASVLASSSRSPVTSFDTSLTQKLYGLDPTTALYDRFFFKIHLTDLLLRIEEKTLVLAICYRTAGKEYWDNNDGQNYRATFERRSRGLLERMHRTIPGQKKADNDDSDDDPLIKKELEADKPIFGLGLGINVKKELDEVPLSSPTKRGRSLTLGGPGGKLLGQYSFDDALKNTGSWKSPADFPLKRPHCPRNLKHSSDSKTKNEHKLPVSFSSHWVDFGGRSFARGSPRDAERSELDDIDSVSLNVGQYRLSDATPEDQPFSRAPAGFDANGSLSLMTYGSPSVPMNEYFPFALLKFSETTRAPSLNLPESQTADTTRPGILSEDSPSPMRSRTGNLALLNTQDSASVKANYDLLGFSSSESSTPSITTDNSSPTTSLSPGSPSDTEPSGLPMFGSLDLGFEEFIKKIRPRALEDQKSQAMFKSSFTPNSDERFPKPESGLPTTMPPFYHSEFSRKHSA